MTTKEMYKNMLCRFINGMIVDAEYSIKEMSDIDFEGVCNIVRAYDKANGGDYPNINVGYPISNPITIIPTWHQGDEPWWRQHWIGSTSAGTSNNVETVNSQSTTSTDCEVQ